MEMVLNYLSDAAGLTIVQDTRVSGYVTITGKHLTRKCGGFAEFRVEQKTATRPSAKIWC